MIAVVKETKIKSTLQDFIYYSADNAWATIMKSKCIQSFRIERCFINKMITISNDKTVNAKI